MNKTETRIRLEYTIQNYINQLMQENNISAAMMEGALNKVILQLKDAIMLNFIAAASSEQPAPIEMEEMNGE